MEILLVGCGAIGEVLVTSAPTLEEVETFLLWDVDPERRRELSKYPKTREVSSLEEGLERAHLVVEAASQEAAFEVVPAALEKSKDVVVLSLGVFSDDSFRQRVVDLARRNRCSIYVPSGALGGLDALRAAREGGLERVVLTTSKPPQALGVPPPSGRRTLYEGPAREAVRLYPKNVNVAASVALAGIGFDRTRVRVVADPSLQDNVHTLEAEGAFGRFTFEVENRPSPSNPRTSLLAGLAAVALLRRITSPLQFG